jgi:uroporphyrinogen-III synthase
MSKRPRRIWITRARPGADETARRLRDLGHDPLVHPLLTVCELSVPAPDLAGVGALAFTSANGVRAFTRLSAARDLPVFAVGEATARAARAAGFAHAEAMGGDVSGLAREIAARRADISGTVLHPGPVEAAGDLVGELLALGVPATGAALYETVAAPVDARLIAALPELDAVLIHSPKAARILAAVLSEHPTPSLRLLAISPAALAPLEKVAAAQRAVAALPLEAELINLIDS